MFVQPMGIHDVLDLEITLRHITPPIRRRLHVAAAFQLDVLHHVIQIAFGWEDQHLHAFHVGDLVFAAVDEEDDDAALVIDEAAAPLGAVARVGQSFEYRYDFGDDWVHEVKVLGVVSQPKAPLQCVDGARACPLEDCGGPPGYEELVKALSNKRHPRHAEIKEWVGHKYDPEKLDLKATNRKLKQLMNELLSGV